MHSRFQNAFVPSSLLPLILAAVTGLVGIPGQANAQGSDSKTDKIEFGADSEKPVFAFTKGRRGFAKPGVEVKQPPKIRIFKDGTVKTGGRLNYVPYLESKISQERLMRLLKLAVYDAKLFDVTSQAIKAKVRAAGLPRIADGASSFFKINLAQGEHVVQAYSLSTTAKRNGDDEELANLLKIETMCDRIYYETHLGTVADRDSLLSAIQDQLNRELPDVIPFAMEDILFAAQDMEGGIRGVFRKTSPVNGVPHYIEASFKRKRKTAEFEVEITKSEIRVRSR